MITTEETIMNMAEANAFNRWNTTIVKTINTLIKDKKFMKLNRWEKKGIVFNALAKENRVLCAEMNKEIKEFAKEHNISADEIVEEYSDALDDLVLEYTRKIKPTTKRIDRVVLVGVYGEDELYYGYHTAKEIRTLAKSYKVVYTACRVDLTIKDMGLEDVVTPDCLYEEEPETEEDAERNALIERIVKFSSVQWDISSIEMFKKRTSIKRLKELANHYEYGKDISPMEEPEEEISGMYIPEYDEEVTDSVTKGVTDSVTKGVTDSVTKGVTDSVTKVGDRFCNSIILLLQYYYTKLFTMKSEDFFFNLALLLSRLKIPINNTLFRSENNII